MVERPIQPGDVVEAAGTSGSVREIGLRATIIRTFDGADVVMPNGLLLSWCNDIGDYGTLRGELLARVLAALSQAGIAIPYPQMDLHLRSMPPAPAPAPAPAA